jgi:hypothetical protein
MIISLSACGSLGNRGNSSSSYWRNNGNSRYKGNSSVSTAESRVESRASKTVSDYASNYTSDFASD